MWEENNVIVVDDNQQRRHDAQVILDFLGENPVTYSCQEWTTLVAKPESQENTRQIKTLVFGECST